MEKKIPMENYKDGVLKIEGFNFSTSPKEGVEIDHK